MTFSKNGLLSKFTMLFQLTWKRNTIFTFCLTIFDKDEVLFTRSIFYIQNKPFWSSVQLEMLTPCNFFWNLIVDLQRVSLFMQPGFVNFFCTSWLVVLKHIVSMSFGPIWTIKMATEACLLLLLSLNMCRVFLNEWHKSVSLFFRLWSIYRSKTCGKILLNLGHILGQIGLRFLLRIQFFDFQRTKKELNYVEPVENTLKRCNIFV